MTLRRRLALLLACAAGGAAVGGVGHALTGETAWYAAITIAIALGWLVVADPGACEPGQR